MRPSEILQLKREQVLALIAKSRAANVRVFGSVERGENREGSDLDLLVDPLPGATLFDLGALQLDLEDLLGVRVDLLAPGDIPAIRRGRILRDALPII